VQGFHLNPQRSLSLQRADQFILARVVQPQRQAGDQLAMAEPS
jgi:hypothetical protein